MAVNIPRYLSLSGLAEATVVERGALERMLARRIISADAEMKFGRGYIPLFLEENAIRVIVARQKIQHDSGTLPRR